MSLKKQAVKKRKSSKNHLSNFIVFKEKENKFQIDYQKILKFRDLSINEIN